MLPMVATFADHPFPVQRGCQQVPRFPRPRKWPEATHLIQRKSNVPAIADDVYEQCLWNVGFDARDVQNGIGIVYSPPADTLILGDLVHCDANEVAAVPAFAENPLAELLGV